MSRWVELNRDGLLASPFVAILMLPIAEIFTSFMNRKRDKKKPNNKSEKNKSKKNNKCNEYVTNKTNVVKPQVVEIKTVYIEKTTRSDSDSNSEVFIIWLIVIVAATTFFYKYKELISNIIYMIGWLGFWINITMLVKEYKRPSKKKLDFLLIWTALLWGYIIYSIHLLYHPIYFSKSAVIAEQAIKNGQGLFTGGLDGSAYLIYQFLGIVVLVVLILFVVTAQMYSLIVWWNESRDISSSIKFIEKSLYALDKVFYPNYKFVLISTFIIGWSFMFESGILINMILK